jgi:tellurite resistance protein TehA-like permease
MQAKTDDMTREDFHLVKHTKLTHFGMHMGLAGLAVAWQLAATTLPGVGNGVYYAIGLLAAVMFVAWLAMYALRAIQYPQKVSGRGRCVRVLVVEAGGSAEVGLLSSGR